MKLQTKLTLFWHRLWIRKDEFHSSLNLDATLMWDMTKEEQEEYLEDLARRRKKAHKKV